MLRRTFLKAVIAATSTAAVAKFIPLQAAEPVLMGYAYMVKDTGEVMRQSKTPVWSMRADWRERLANGEMLQLQAINFGRAPEAATCSAIRLELESVKPMCISLSGARAFEEVTATLEG